MGGKLIDVTTVEMSNEGKVPFGDDAYIQFSGMPATAHRWLC